MNYEIRQGKSRQVILIKTPIIIDKSKKKLRIIES
jgi:hypothetical protein